MALVTGRDQIFEGVIDATTGMETQFGKIVAIDGIWLMIEGQKQLWAQTYHKDSTRPGCYCLKIYETTFDL